MGRPWPWGGPRRGEAGGLPPALPSERPIPPLETPGTGGPGSYAEAPPSVGPPHGASREELPTPSAAGHDGLEAVGGAHDQGRVQPDPGLVVATIRDYWDDKDYGFANPGDDAEHVFFRKDVFPGGIAWVVRELSLHGWRVEGWVVIRRSGPNEGKPAFQTAWLLPPEGPPALGPEPAEVLERGRRDQIWDCLQSLGGQAWLSVI